MMRKVTGEDHDDDHEGEELDDDHEGEEHHDEHEGERIVSQTQKSSQSRASLMLTTHS